MNVIAVGYSNGANIAANLLFHYADTLKRAILHHPMLPRSGVDLPGVAGIPMFIIAGENNPICLTKESEELERLLAGTGAVMEVHWEMNGAKQHL